MSRLNQSERWSVSSRSTVFSIPTLRASVGGILIIWSLMRVVGVTEAASAAPPGLLARFGESLQEFDVRDIEVFDRLALYVPANEPVTPFFDAEAFEVEWGGQLSVPLRDDYRFRAYVEGSFELEINGESVLSIDQGMGWSEAFGEVRLEKGTNSVVARFRNLPGSDASLRVEWSSPDFLFEPINDRHWSYQPIEGQSRYAELRAGRSLFIELRCGACHVDDAGESLGASLLPGVDLSQIGARRRSAWIHDWILDPKQRRSRSKMPVVFRGARASDEVSAVLAYLLETSGDRVSLEIDGNASAGKLLYSELNCSGCHYQGQESVAHEERLWLGNVSRKFFPGALVSFLQKPNQHFPAIQMPQFGLTDREASDLAAFLMGESSAVPGAIPRRDQELLMRGKELVVERGCVNCHSGLLGLSNSSKPVLGVKLQNLDRGCLSETLGAGDMVPDFRLSDQQRRWLRSVLAAKQDSFTRKVPRVEARRHQTRLNCAACHGEIDGVPGLDHVGAKLKAHWMTDLFQGELKSKSRPWLKARMPAFPAYGEELAVGLSHLHGYSGVDEAVGPIDSKLAGIGRQLVSPVEGFSCVSCHGVASLKPTQVFESEGINFSLSANRLRKDYYRRWLLNPLRIDPASKMPVYFDEEGTSPLYDVLDGDTDRQLEAIWHYFLKGDAMVPPLLE